MRQALLLVLLLSVATLVACRRQHRSAAPRARASAGPALVVREAPFERRVLLSGEIDAVALAELKVPRVPLGQVTVRWLETDGAAVKAGQKVAELDNAAFATAFTDKQLAASQAEIALRRQEWQNGLAEADHQLDVERKKTIVRRAEIDADVPEGILPKRDYLEKQLALRKARSELEKAEEALVSLRKTSAYDVDLKKIALERAEREVALAANAIKELTVRAPVAGTIIIADHWDGRKLQVGDDVYLGNTVARIPDLQQLRVRGWLSDVDDGRVTPGMPVDVVMDAFPDERLAGKILDIAPVAREPSERSLRRVFQVGVALERRGDSRLRPGMSARIEVIAERRERALLVPRVALDLSKNQPLVALADGRTSAVTLGACNPTECIATSGVALGTRVRRVAP